MGDLPPDQMPDTLRNGLWQACLDTFFAERSHSSGYGNSFDPDFKQYCERIYRDLFRSSVDLIPNYPDLAFKELRERFFSGAFHEVYDFIEFLSKECDPMGRRIHRRFRPEAFTEACNKVFARERASFRFAGAVLVMVTSQVELDEVKSSIGQDGALTVREHIKRAAELYSSRTIPDYRNSVKESISAVEAAVRYVTGKRTTGVSRPLRMIEERFSIHPALRDGFEKLYAFSSDADGVRHSLMDESSITMNDARYMLVACSAFANYLIAMHSER